MTDQPDTPTRCGNCSHDPDAHSPVGRETCSYRDCPCPGLLTVAAPEADDGPGLREAAAKLVADWDGLPHGLWTALKADVAALRSALEGDERA